MATLGLSKAMALGAAGSQVWGQQASLKPASAQVSSRVVGRAAPRAGLPSSNDGDASSSAARNIAAHAVAVEGPSAAAPPPPSVEPARLEPRVEERDGFWVLKEEYRSSLNPAEKLKIAKEPMKFFTEGLLEEMAAVPFAELDASKEGKDDIDIRLKWLGFFHRRKQQYGRFMMRLKLPNGITTSAQTRYLASVIDKYGEEGCADITTRQNWQIRGVVLEDGPAIMKGLQEVGLTSIQSGMDNVRNAVGSPLAGIDPCEILDTRPYNDALNDYIIGSGKGNLSITNLPRKWNVCVVGSHDLYEHPHINDLAYMPAMKDGVLGFNLLVGGFFSNKRCAEAVPLDAWVPDTDVVASCRAVLEAFRDLGARGNRQKTRMMWLIDELGVEGFREEVAKRMPAGALPRAAEEELVDKAWKRREYLGVHPQKQEGLNYLGLLVPVGRLQAADMYELARLAEEYGSGELRLTVEQNVVIPNVPDAMLESLLKEPLLQRFTPFPGSLAGGVVACTGNQFCGQAIIETKVNAVKLTEELEATMDIPSHVRMHWTGCPNTCAQVQVADIGFMGCTARDENRKPVEGVDIYLGGRIGSDSHLGEVWKSQVPISGLLPIVQDLLIEKFGATRKAEAEV